MLCINVSIKLQKPDFQSFTAHVFKMLFCKQYTITIIKTI